jgi:hypothetical protein
VYIDIFLAVVLLLFLLPLFLFLFQTLSLAVMALAVPNQVQEYLDQDLSSDRTFFNSFLYLGKLKSTN